MKCIILRRRKTNLKSVDINSDRVSSTLDSGLISEFPNVSTDTETAAENSSLVQVTPNIPIHESLNFKSVSNNLNINDDYKITIQISKDISYSNIQNPTFSLQTEIEKIKNLLNNSK